MAIRPIKRKHGNHKCDWCGERATRRGYGWGKVACAAHLPELIAWDQRESAPDYSDAAFAAGY